MEHGARIGAVYGFATVVGEALVPYVWDASGRPSYCVSVECWSCRARRDLRWDTVRYGLAGLCRSCGCRGKHARARPSHRHYKWEPCPCPDCFHTRSRRRALYGLPEPDLTHTPMLYSPVMYERTFSDLEERQAFALYLER
jgi:hypothetical protein